MWVSIANKWKAETTSLERFLTERIVQRCDYEEIISNRHRTTNGYTQTKELIKLCELSLKRERTVKTLVTLVEETRSKNIPQNIENDFIIVNYFSDLRDFVKKINIETLTLSGGTVNLLALKNLQHNLKIFNHQLDSFYFAQLIKEFNLIDYKNEEKYETKANQISNLIDLLIPYLLFNGYALSSLNEVLLKYKEGEYRPTVNRLFSYFNFSKRDFAFIINLGEKTRDVDGFVLQFQESYDLMAIQIKKENLPQWFSQKYSVNENSIVIKFPFKTIDPHSFIRSSYDKLLKHILIKKERPNPFAFNDYFDRCFWHNLKTPHLIHPVKLEFDPINVAARKSTFRKTIIKICAPKNKIFSEEEEFSIPKNDVLAKAIYYYNLALSSKSIENSLSLLWTSLESVLPYRVSPSDIQCVQHFVSKSLAIGSLSRDIYSFAMRFIQTNKQNENKLSGLGTMDFKNVATEEGLLEWFNWFVNVNDPENKTTTLKLCSELLPYLFSRIGKPLSQGNLQFIYDRILASEESIKYQLQRIYLHRNQIVHSGNLVNEYTNLWLHLEWYIGKLLAYAYYKQEIENETCDLEETFRKLEADHDYLLSYLKKNSNKKVNQSSRINNLLFKHVWQSF